MRDVRSDGGMKLLSLAVISDVTPIRTPCWWTTKGPRITGTFHIIYNLHLLLQAATYPRFLLFSTFSLILLLNSTRNTGSSSA